MIEELANATRETTQHPRSIDRLLSPRSIAILGMSSKLGSVGHSVLKNLTLNAFAGPIYLVGRTVGEIEGLTIETDVAALPEDVDLAILTLPATGVEAAIRECAAKGVGAAVVFASGFAETGGSGSDAQNRIGRLVDEAGMVVIGPNCMGMHNYVNGLQIFFARPERLSLLPSDERHAVAIAAQSGGVTGHLRQALEARGVPISYGFTTGNEMNLTTGDLIRYLVDDDHTGVIAVYSEHVQSPEHFLAAAELARERGKPIVMLHPGRSAKAQAAAASHTGALAGDYAMMRTAVERTGVVLVESLDELLDVTELLARFPAPQKGGLGVVTFSGAFAGIAHDFVADLGVEIPLPAARTRDAMASKLPAYLNPSNPLDLGTEALRQPDLLASGIAALLDDEAIGAVAISIPPASPAHTLAFVDNIVAARGTSGKPVGLAFLGDGSPLPQDFYDRARTSGLVHTRSSDRLLRAMAHVIKRGNRVKLPRSAPHQQLTLPKIEAHGVLPEWQGKKLLAAVGIATPQGGLVNTVEDAVAIANRIGFPVVMKAQSARLAHKTEAGGVLLNLADDKQVREGWHKLSTNVERAMPGLVLDGMLVEQMAPRGLEFVVGAKRDPAWGPAVLVGLGGILVEALKDVRLIAPTASLEEIVEELDRLRAAPLLHGFRNIAPVDVQSIAKAVQAIGRLMLDCPAIMEVDVNPLIVYDREHGAIALDALIVTASKEKLS